MLNKDIIMMPTTKSAMVRLITIERAVALLVSMFFLLIELIPINAKKSI